MKYDIALIGTGGPIADALIKSFAASGMKSIGFGRTPPRALDLLTQFIEFGIENPRNFTQTTEAKTLIFSAGIKGRFNEGSVEHKRQEIVSAPDMRKLLSSMNILCDRLITMGSSEEFGARENPVEIFENSELSPISSYGTSKVALYHRAQDWRKESGKPILHIRPFNVFGPGMDTQMFVGSLLTTLLKGEVFNMTKGEQWRSFVSISLFCRCFVELVKLQNWDQVNRNDSFNLSGPNYLELCEVVRLVQELIPNSKVNLGAVPYRTFEVWHQNPNLDFMKKLTGTDFFEDMSKELKKTIEYYRSNL